MPQYLLEKKWFKTEKSGRFEFVLCIVQRTQRELL